MKEFAFASPRTEAEALGLLAARRGQTEILAGGTDLTPLLKSSIVEPETVVNILEIRSLHGIHADSQSVTLGALVSLEELLDAPEMQSFGGVLDACRGVSSMQLRSQGTLGGELCQRPQCWYFRSGHGLLAENGRMALRGDNRLHAILGNGGPAKFVSSSRLAPALIALGAQVRIAGPAKDEETFMPLESFYRAPRTGDERETILAPNQLLTHITLPFAGWQSATYEVRHGEGPEFPLAAAAVALKMAGSFVSQARIVLGQAAPTPWVSDAAQLLAGREITPELAMEAGEAALAAATPLSDNAYKVQLARVAVKRALLRAAGLETGGF